MSYQMRISPRDRQSGRFIHRVHKEIQSNFLKSGMTQQQLATKLGVNRSIVNRQLVGTGNLTLRSISDLAWAMGRRATLQFYDESETSRNEYLVATTPENANFSSEVHRPLGALDDLKCVVKEITSGVELSSMAEQ